MKKVPALKDLSLKPTIKYKKGGHFEHTEMRFRDRDKLCGEGMEAADIACNRQEDLA